MPEVEATCDRILIINRGKIVADGTADTLRKQAKGQELLKVKIEDGSPEEIADALRNLISVGTATILDMATNSFEIESTANMSSKREVFQLCVQNNWVLTEMIPFETKLEDIFRDLTVN